MFSTFYLLLPFAFPFNLFLCALLDPLSAANPFPVHTTGKLLNSFSSHLNHFHSNIFPFNFDSFDSYRPSTNLTSKIIINKHFVHPSIQRYYWVIRITNISWFVVVENKQQQSQCRVSSSAFYFAYASEEILVPCSMPMRYNERPRLRAYTHNQCD